MSKNDLYSMYNEMNDMINSIDIKDDDVVKDDEVVYIEEEPVVIEDKEEIPNIIDDDIEIIEDEDFIDNDDVVTIMEPESLDNQDTSLETGDVVEPKEQSIDSTSTEEPTDSDDIVSIDEIEKLLDDEKTKELVVDYVKDNKKEKKKKTKKVKKEKQEKKKSSKGWVITFSILDVIAIVCLFLMYGPISYFRNLWVTSAMTTMRHKYLAYIFFNQNSINHILENNKVIESGSDGTTDGVDIAGEDPGIYESIYEEQVLKRNPGNDLYKVIDVEGNGYKGHLLVVYDPSRVHLYQYERLNHGGKQLNKMLELAGAKAGTNASGFSVNYNTYQYTIAGSVIMNGKVISNGGSTGWGGGIIGFTNDNKLLLTKKSAYEAVKMGVRDGMSFGPFLVVNGEPSKFKGNGGYGIAPRTAIGQRKDGIVLMLVIDGRRPGHSLGVDMVELTNIMVKYGAYNASNLDGGGSSSMVVDGKVLSVAGGSGYSGERYLPNAWIVK